jgi:diguanylate cyclase (GGDEF)-like protein/PAS domain S-box-containing protein
LSDDAIAGWLAQIPELSSEAALILSLEDGAVPRERVVYANAALGSLLGRAASALYGRSLDVLRAQATDTAALAHLRGAARSRQLVHMKLLVAGPSKSAWVEISGRALRGHGDAYLILLRDVTRQSAMADALKLLNQRFEALTALTSEAVFYFRLGPDCRLALEWCAGAFERMSGYKPSEIEGMGGFSAVVESADLRIVQTRAQRWFTGSDTSVEYRIRARDGRLCWLQEVGRPQWDAQRELVVGVLCVARDVSKMRSTEQSLQAKEDDWRALARLSGDLVCVLDDEGRLLDAAGTPQGDLGGQLRAGIGRPLREILGEEAASAWRMHMAHAVPGSPGIGFELPWSGSSSEEIYRIRLAAAAGGATLALVRLNSVARPPEVQPEPRVEVRALLDLQTSAAVLLTPELTVADLNATAEHLTGWERSGALGRPFVELMAVASEQPDMARDLQRAALGGPVAGSEAWLRLPSGQEGRIVWNYLPLKDGAGRILGVLAEGHSVAPLSDSAGAPIHDRVRLKAIMDHGADGIIAIDGRGAIVSLSRSAEALFGYSQDELVGRGVAEIILPGADGGDLLELVVAANGEARESREMLARLQSGQVVPIELSAGDVILHGETLYILTVRDIALRRQTEDAIRDLAYHDPLTGLPNRLLFNDRLSQAIERARRNRQVVAVMILDLDRFKLINDSLGLASGDRVLHAVAERLVATLRRSDTVARLAGDDFLLLLPGVEGAENAAKVAQKLLDAVLPPLQVDDQELHIRASVGITLFPHDGEDAETLIRNADTALYRAKEHARSSYQFYTTDMNATAFERLVLETQLRKALERGELVVHYQPQVRLDTGEVVGVEALVRWFHGELGLISPAEFIPLAEETGLILELGRWVLGTACEQVRRWQGQGFAELRLGVNLSGRQFQEADLVHGIAQALEKTGLDPRDLELELTESSIMRDPEQAVAKLHALSRLGIRLSIDDFGTGYSSLAHLKRFPIKALKIDQSFIRDITTEPNDAAIAQAIIALAESLRLKVVAEGVETREQLDLLRRFRCDEMQGYLFSKPLPPDDLLELLKRGARLAD